MSAIDVKNITTPNNFDLTINTVGSGTDIIFKSNGTQTAKIDQAGNLTLTGTVDGVDIQTLNTAVTANTAKTGITSGQATAITAALPKAGGTMTGTLTAVALTASGNVGLGNTNPSSYDGGGHQLVVGNPSETSAGMTLTAGTNNIIYFAKGTTGDEAYRGSITYNHASDYMNFRTGGFTERMRIDSAGNMGIGTTSPTAKLEIAGASNTVGSTQLIRLGESAFRVMTGGEQHMLCLDRDNNGGTKKVMQSWNPDTGDVAIGSAVSVAAGRLMIKSSSLTQAQLKLQGQNYSYGAEIMSQNGSESGTVGNTRCWFKTDLVTLGNTRRFWTASSQIGTDTQSFSIANNQKIHMSSETIKMNHTNLGTAQDVRFGNWVGNGSGYGVKIATGSPQGMILIETSASTARDLMHFNNSNGLVGKIQTSGTATSYVTSSDHRLKENVDYTWDATTRLKQLKPARFNFIVDDTKTVDGFLAHEAAIAVPECVTGEKDAMKDEEYEVTAAVEDDGAIITPAVMGTRSVADYQVIDQAKLVPLLVKTIQELEARITALEA